MRDILTKLDKVRGNGKRYRAKCPVSDQSSGDNTLSILFSTDGRTLIHCHAGCEASEILAHIGMTLSDLYPDGAIQDFMASAQKKPKEGRYDSWFELLERKKKQLKKGERLSDETINLAKQMYLRKRG